MEQFANDSVLDAGPNYYSFEQSYVKARPTGPKNQSGTTAVVSGLVKRSPPTSNYKIQMVATKSGTSASKQEATRGIPAASRSTPQQIAVTLQADNVICFYGREHYLSNFYSCPLTINGHRYYSVEHYYEAVKLFHFTGPQGAVQLKNVSDPCAAKAISRRVISGAKIDRKLVEQWRRQTGVQVVKRALAEKFSTGSELARKLIATGQALLVQANPHDALWAVNMNEQDFANWIKKNDKVVVRLPLDITAGTINALPSLGQRGKNLLGFLLMQLRRQLQIQERHCDNRLGQMAAIVEEDTTNAEETATNAGNKNDDTAVDEDDVVIIDDGDGIAESAATTLDDDDVTIINERCEAIGRRLAEINMLQMEKDCVMREPAEAQQQRQTTTMTEPMSTP